MKKYATILYVDGIIQTHDGVKSLVCENGRVVINEGYPDEWRSDAFDAVSRVIVVTA